MAISISVIIPTHQRPESLSRVLAALKHQTVSLRDLEIVVVLDGACCDTEKVLARSTLELPLRWCVQTARGAPAARNRGLAEAHGDIVVFLDDDVIAGHELLERHLEWHRRRPDLLVFGTFLKSPESPQGLMQQAVDWCELHRARCIAPGFCPEPKDVVDGNMSAHREWLLSLGGWDETFTGVGGSDDAELARRWVGRGYRLQFEAGAVGYHYWTKTWSQYLIDRRQIGRAHHYLAQKHPTAAPELHVTRFDRTVARRVFTRVLSAVPEFAFRVTEIIVGRIGCELDSCCCRSVLSFLIALSGAAFYLRGYHHDNGYEQHVKKASV